VKLVVVLYGSAERVLEHFGKDIFKMHRYVARWWGIILIGFAVDMLNLRERSF
jgi:threonine/homoserine/homoserine lactone efflux protein